MNNLTKFNKAFNTINAILVIVNIVLMIFAIQMHNLPLFMLNLCCFSLAYLTYFITKVK
jgi:hypothetical protein